MQGIRSVSPYRATCGWRWLKGCVGIPTAGTWVVGHDDASTAVQVSVAGFSRVASPCAGRNAHGVTVSDEGEARLPSTAHTSVRVVQPPPA